MSSSVTVSFLFLLPERSLSTMFGTLCIRKYIECTKEVWQKSLRLGNFVSSKSASVEIFRSGYMIVKIVMTAKNEHNLHLVKTFHLWIHSHKIYQYKYTNACKKTTQPGLSTESSWFSRRRGTRTQILDVHFPITLKSYKVILWNNIESKSNQNR